MRRLLLALIVLSASAWAQYTDDFNRTNGSSLGTNWTLGPGGSPQISSNKACANGSNIYQAYTGGGATYPNDQYAQATYVNASTSRAVGLAVRVSGTGASAKAYALSMLGSNGWTLLKYTAGTTSSSLTTGSAIAAGSVVKLQVVGNTISVIDDGTVVGTYTDNSSPITSGSAGILSNGTASTAACLDDWSGGSASASYSAAMSDSTTTSESLSVSQVHDPNVNRGVSDSTTTTASWSATSLVSPIASDNFNSYANGTALDTATAPNWKSLGSCVPTVNASGQAAGCSGTNPAIVYTGKTFPANQYSEAMICSTAGTNGDVIVRASSSAQTWYGFRVYCGGAEAELYKMVNGTKTSIISLFPLNTYPMDTSKPHTIRLSVVGNKLYPTIDGLSVGPVMEASNYARDGFDAFYTDNSISSGYPGIAFYTGGSSSLDTWQGGSVTSNVNIIEGKRWSYTNDFTNIPAGTTLGQVPPWYRLHVLPAAMSAPFGAWIGQQVIKADGGVGAGSQDSSSQVEHQGEYGADQYMEVTLGVDTQADALFNNLFFVLKHQNVIPGFLAGGSYYAVDYVGYYFGTEPMNHDPLNKSEYSGDGVWHLTKITPTVSSGNNEVVAVATTPVFPQVGDKVRVETRGNNLMMFVNDSLILHAIDNDLNGAQGYPALFLGTFNFTDSYFKNIKTGTLTDYAMGNYNPIHVTAYHTETLTPSSSVSRANMNYTRAVSDGANATENVVASCAGTCSNRQPIVTFIM